MSSSDEFYLMFLVSVLWWLFCLWVFNKTALEYYEQNIAE